jgi:hypothetical protein
MTTAGDLAALLGGARVRRASATLRSTDDPAATLHAWSSAGPWQAEAAQGDPAVFGLPPGPTVQESRQWVDRVGDRAREERGSLVLAREGTRWWRAHPGIGPEAGEGELEVAAILDRWTDPQPLTQVLELSFAGDAQAGGRDALRVEAIPRDDAFAAALTPLGWGAARWELLVDASRGMLLATTAFTAEGDPFRQVEALELTVDEPLDEALFARPAA